MNKAEKLIRACELLGELKDLLTCIDDEDFDREYDELEELHDRVSELHTMEIENEE